MVIHEIEKNSLEKIVIELTEYQGRKYFSTRIYYDASKGQNQDWRPTPKGITISIDLLPELKEGVDKALFHVVQEKEFPEKKEKGEDQLRLPDPGPEQESEDLPKTEKDEEDPDLKIPF